MSAVLCVVCPKENAHSLRSLMPRNYCRCSSSDKLSSKLSFSSGVSAYSSAVANPSRSVEERVHEVVLKQADLMREHRRKTAMDLEKPIENDRNIHWNRLNEAFERCREVTAEYAKTFYLGTLLMTPERQRAIWESMNGWTI
nr:phytoene synthase, chloroplastic [Quercus suber]